MFLEENTRPYTPGSDRVKGTDELTKVPPQEKRSRVGRNIYDLQYHLVGKPAKTCYPIVVDGRATLNPGLVQTPRVGGMQTEAPADAGVMTLSPRERKVERRQGEIVRVLLDGGSTGLVAYVCLP